MYSEENPDIPQNILEQASADLLPAKSRLRYEHGYQPFMEWRDLNKVKTFLLIAFVPLALCDVSHILSSTTEPPGPPRPYAFGYAAGRFPGHIDRTHSEISDGAGTIKGSYSYVDPRHQIRTVDYVADKQGFHPVLNNSPPPLPVDSPIVAAAKQRHLQQFASIANAHQSAPNVVAVPSDSVSVHNAKVKHFSLYQQIAEEHARLGEERKALGLAAEAEPNHVEHNY